MNQNLELWAGVECTVNRVRDRYLDQLEMSGHAGRASDLALFADLGIKTLRFPVIWERIIGKNGKADWSWTDERLSLARDCGIRPIAGFVHHGSGPRDTHLLDSDFAHKLGDFAAAFADRYPWIELYTPINEPLTTARFSGLYGLWYPHRQDNASFLQMLLHQCQGIAEAMKAVRRVAPKAQLLQTEDLGKIFSTLFLLYQAQFENERRWLSLDILMGRVGPEHTLWKFIQKSGGDESAWLRFVEEPCVPDIIGINHYITSNRFLDERLERYPDHVQGGNGRHRYADIEAVRVGAENLAGPKELLMEVWERYQRPVAITEVHMGCTHDEQMRWLHEAWQSAEELRKQKVDIRAVTAWSLLGSYDWDSLVTEAQGHYESGVFDNRAAQPRPTGLAHLVSALAKGQSYDHPVLDTPGWWHRPDRLLYPSVALTPGQDLKKESSTQLSPTPRRILITGGDGTLAKALSFLCECRGLACHIASKKDLDITQVASIHTLFDKIRPWAVINAAGTSRVDQAEEQGDACRRSHAEGPVLLAETCAMLGIPLVTFSSDLVFDGQSHRPYVESDPVNPLNVYGRCKAEAEREVARRHPSALIIRSAGFFGPWDEHNFLIKTLRSLKRGQTIFAAADVVISPTYLPDLLNASLDLLIDGASGTWHVTNAGAVSWHDFACEMADRHGLNRDQIRAVPAVEMGWLAQRPLWSVLSSERGCLLPNLEHAMNRFVRECRVAF